LVLYLEFKKVVWKAACKLGFPASRVYGVAAAEGAITAVSGRKKNSSPTFTYGFPTRQTFGWLPTGRYSTISPHLSLTD
jgi:hypothetical protein